MSDFLESWEEKSGRIIVFAGVFDPIHKGHIAIAKEAEKLYGAEVVFLPERVPQHKHGTASYEHRLEMIRVATEEEPDLSVFDYPEDHHWIEDTFTWLTKQVPDRKFAWLVGSDVAGLIKGWPGAERLLELNVNLIVIAKRINVPYEIGVGKSIVGVRTAYVQGKYKHMSSGFIRKDLKHRHTSLPAGVYNYIKKHDLYS